MIKKLFSFLASLNNSVNYAIFIIVYSQLLKKHIFKYQGYCYILHDNGHLQIFPIISEVT